MCVFMCMDTYTQNIHISTWRCTCIWRCICLRSICIWICVCMYMRVYVYVCVYANVYAYVAVAASGSQEDNTKIATDHNIPRQRIWGGQLSKALKSPPQDSRDATDQRSTGHGQCLCVVYVYIHILVCVYIYICTYIYIYLCPGRAILFTCYRTCWRKSDRNPKS